MHQQQDLIQNLDRNFLLLNSRMSELEEKLEQADSGKAPVQGMVSDSLVSDGRIELEEVQRPHLSKKIGRRGSKFEVLMVVRYKLLE